MVMSLNRGLRRAMQSEASESIRGTLRRGPQSSRGAHRRFSLDHAKNVALLHDEQVLTIILDFGARPLPEKDAVTRLDVERTILSLSSRPPSPAATTSPCIGFSWISFCTATAPAMGEMMRRAQQACRTAQISEDARWHCQGKSAKTTKN
jgi:hypothetical protein